MSSLLQDIKMTDHLRDEDILYEMMKEFIQHKGEIERCYTINEYGGSPSDRLKFILNMLILCPGAVSTARFNALVDASDSETQCASSGDDS